MPFGIRPFSLPCVIATGSGPRGSGLGEPTDLEAVHDRELLAILVGLVARVARLVALVGGAVDDSPSAAFDPSIASGTASTGVGAGAASLISSCKLFAETMSPINVFMFTGFIPLTIFLC